MPNEIYLMRVGMTMTEGMVSEWLVADGAEVKKGELLYHLETEKVDMEVDADDGGIVKHVLGIGVACEPGDVIGWIFAPGEEIPAVLPSGKKLSPEEMPVAEEDAALASAAPDAAPSPAAPASQQDVANRGIGGRLLSSPAARRVARDLGIGLESILGTGPGGRIVEADVQAAAQTSSVRGAPPVSGRIKASPLARRTAEELGVDLARVVGSGPGGRITKEDVDAAHARPSSVVGPKRVSQTSPVGPRAGEKIPLRGMRKTISQRMHESLQSTAQLTMDMEVVMDEAVKLREQLIAEWEPEGVRPSYTDLVVRAVAKSLELHPRMNSRMGEGEIELLDEIHVGVAVALEEGLVVPVVRDTLGRDVKSIAQEASRLALAARAGTLGIDDMHGGTFTVSTLGMFGVDSFTPILNPPQTGIIGVNRIADGVGWEGDRPVKRKTMRLSLTWDHRVLDGEPAARFLASVRDLLEAPYRLLV